MKKIVFLFCLAFLNVPQTIEAEDMLTCNGSTVVVDSNPTTPLSITMNGSSPFKTVIDDEGIKYYVNDVLCTNEGSIYYGYLHNDNADTFYDAFFIALDNDGNVVMKHVQDDGGLEEVKEIVYIDYTYFVRYQYSEDVDHEIEYRSSHILMVNQVFEVVSSYDVQRVREMDYKGNLLLLNYEYDNLYDLGISSSGDTFYSGDIIELEEVYYGRMSIDYINDGFLNGSKVSNGISVDYPGVYDFTYYDQVHHFIVHPIISGIEDMAVYSEPLSISFDNGNARLNNEPYLSGEMIDSPGNYTFTIDGINGYILEVNFTITPNITGVINGHTYENNIVIEFEGEGYLNNNKVTSPLELDEKGDYVLKVKGVNGYLETYQFSIIETQNKSFASIVQNLDIFFVVIIVVCGVIILKKK